jgi:hypothetical protein
MTRIHHPHTTTSSTTDHHLRVVEDSSSFLGLGFDPTENMDSVIMSPDHPNENNNSQFDDIDMSALSLDATPVVVHNPFLGGGITTTTSTHQFLGSSTWGTNPTSTGGISTLSNWDYLNAADTTTATSSSKDATTATSSSSPMKKPASFLSLSSLGKNNEHATWSSGPFANGLTSIGATTTTTTTGASTTTIGGGGFNNGSTGQDTD